MNDYPGLNRAYNKAGIDHIPVLSFFDSDWNEVGRWVERPAAATQRIYEWKRTHPDIQRLEASDLLEDKRRLREVYRGLTGEMARWYVDGLWQETIAEIAGNS